MVRIFKVVFSRKARKRLREIVEYYKEKASPTVADKIRKGILQAIRGLEKAPESRPLLPNSEGLEESYRYTRKWSYKIIFRIFEQKNVVKVLTIRHDKEDTEKLKKDLE